MLLLKDSYQGVWPQSPLEAEWACEAANGTGLLLAAQISLQESFLL